MSVSLDWEKEKFLIIQLLLKPVRDKVENYDHSCFKK